MRRFTAIAAGAFVAMGLMVTAAPAQAATVSCPIPTSGPINCTVVPNKKPVYTTATSLNIAPDTAKYKATVTASGRVYTLNGKERTGNNVGTVYLYFRKDGETAFAYITSTKTNAAGYYSKGLTSWRSGTWRAKFAGHVSTTSVTGRSSSYSNLDHVLVYQSAEFHVPFTGPTGLTAHWVSAARQTKVTGVSGARHTGNIVITYSLLCNAPGGSVTFTLVGLNNGLTSSVARTFSGTVVSGTVSLPSRDTVSQLHVDVTGGVSCSVSVASGTQSTATYI